MAGPFIPIVSSIVSAAADRAQKRLDEASDRNRDQVERLVAYLRAISDTVQGLETEADELLSQCRYADWANEQWRQDFLKRCSSYLDVDRLRPKLSQALQGLDASRSVLLDRADAYFQRPANRVQRQGVMLDVQNAVHQYSSYLHRLALGAKDSAAVGAGPVLVQARRRIAEVTTAEEAQAAKEDILPAIEASYEDRVGHQAAGALERLAVRVQDAFL